MITTKNFLYAMTCLLFSMILGAGIYETLTVWPNAFKAPPASLSMFQGDYAIKSGIFWTYIHPLTLVSFIITLIVSWKTPRRKNVLIVLVVYIIIMVITLSYFVPELVAISSSEYSDIIDPELTERAHTWINLNYIRALIIPIVAIYLYLGLTKPIVVTKDK